MTPSTFAMALDSQTEWRLIETGEPDFTHVALQDRSDALRRLMKIHTTNGVPTVLVAVTRAADVLVTMHALLDSALLILVSPDLSTSSYARSLEQAQPSVVISEDRSSSVNAWAAMRGLNVVTLRPTPRVALHSSPVRRNDSFPGLGFLTSGSTGLPKLVQLAPTQVVAAARLIRDRLELTPADVNLSVSPPHHSLGLITNLLAPLLAGSRTVSADARRVHEVESSLLQEVSWIASTPAGLSFAAAMFAARNVALSSLRLTRSSAAPLSARRRLELHAQFHVPVLSAYAMSEFPGEISSTNVRDWSSGTVGQPTGADVRLDASVSSGDFGPKAIWIKGPLLARNVPSENGWFCTADVGKWDGERLVHLGRSDDMINVGGEKIAPSLVEQSVEECEGVHEAVAFALPDKSLGERVGLAIVGSREVSGRELVRWLVDRYGATYAPKRVFSVDEIPRNSRGKVVRRQMLRALEEAEARVI